MYTYRIWQISEDDKWIHIKCNEEDSMEQSKPFVALVKSIAQKWNNGEWQGMISLAGEMRYRIKNDPINIVYQWDDLYGIVFEYSKNSPKEIRSFILENYGIE